MSFDWPSLGIKRLLVYGDSLLVVQQVNKEWDINKEIMDDYVAEIRKLENKFSGLEIHHVISDNNVAADVLSKLGSDRAEIPPGIFVHELCWRLPMSPPGNSDDARRRQLGWQVFHEP